MRSLALLLELAAVSASTLVLDGSRTASGEPADRPPEELVVPATQPWLCDYTRAYSRSDLAYLNGSLPVVTVLHPPANFTYDDCNDEPMAQILVKFDVDGFPTGPHQGKVVVFVGSTKYFEGGCTDKNLTNPWQMFMGLPQDSRDPFEVLCTITLVDCRTDAAVMPPTQIRLRIHSTKQFAYLLIHDRPVNVAHLISRSSDVFQHELAPADSRAAQSASQNSSTNRARNTLLEAARRTGICYKYLIFVDAGHRLVCPPPSRAASPAEPAADADVLPAQCAAALEGSLMHWLPAIAAPASGEAVAVPAAEDDDEVEAGALVGTAAGAGVTALHHEVVDALLPWPTEWELETSMVADVLIDMLCAYLYPGHCLQLTRVSVARASPRSNMTAVRLADCQAKALAWIMPGLRSLERVMAMVRATTRPTPPGSTVAPLQRPRHASSFSSTGGASAAAASKVNAHTGDGGALSHYRLEMQRLELVERCHPFWSNRTAAVAEAAGGSSEWCRFYDGQAILFDSVLRLAEMLGARYAEDRVHMRAVEQRIARLERASAVRR